MKMFVVEIRDCLRFKSHLHLEAVSPETLRLGLDSTLGMSGCEILDIREYVAPNL